MAFEFAVLRCLKCNDTCAGKYCERCKSNYLGTLCGDPPFEQDEEKESPKKKNGKRKRSQEEDSDSKEQQLQPSESIVIPIVPSHIRIIHDEGLKKKLDEGFKKTLLEQDQEGENAQKKAKTMDSKDKDKKQANEAKKDGETYDLDDQALFSTPTLTRTKSTGLVDNEVSMRAKKHEPFELKDQILLAHKESPNHLIIATSSSVVVINKFTREKNNSQGGCNDCYQSVHIRS